MADHWKTSSSFRGTAADDGNGMFYTSSSSSCVRMYVCARVSTHMFIVALFDSLYAVEIQQT